MHTSTVVLTLLGFLAAQEPPVAMVLSTKGKVTVTTGDKPARPLAAMDLLKPGDKVTAPTDGEAVLVYLADGHRERLKPGLAVDVAKEGGKPPHAVIREAKSKVNQEHLNALRETNPGGVAAVSVLRSKGASDPPAAMPIAGTILLNTQPKFSWPAVPNADHYILELRGTDNRTIWQVTTKETSAPYPEKQAALSWNRRYTWQVLARVGEVDSVFVVKGAEITTATEDEAAVLAKLEPLAKSDDTSEVLLAALTYDMHGAMEPAIAAFERLITQQPNVARFHETLAQYYTRAGLKEKAKAAAEKAKRLAADNAK